MVGLSHRVLVMHKGRVAAELTGEEIVEQRIIAAAFGDFSSGSAGSD